MTSIAATATCQLGEPARSDPPFASGFARVALTDRVHCARPLPEQVLRIAGRIDAIVVRERDLDDDAYERLARAVAAACDEAGVALIVHGRPAVARRMGLNAVHLPLPQLVEQGRPAGIAWVGTNVHEPDEVELAQRSGADYLMASPIFKPSCKPLAAARGLEFLERVLACARLPVLALGGIDDAAERAVRSTGAAGACRMSGYMLL
ncbi:thiamine monophosphate synthase [Coriobacterium glomerans PW2]|uniref:Thiamine monophosphate synthase n=1 Tax=Coriobacterium glomerans (strain ATCC 49209 / DSM 20642 / JCM 10262 / PW2) TaxID=700015 RepID=F2N7A5_CORGP|nr:thiamine phosphate synthase [Coriobacterium glomerans]AEB06580.1 thiamine monophosphate synthase [Coriobacterium glomerans PW2]